MVGPHAGIPGTHARRACDTKLNRDVTIKILPEAFAHDAKRLARFEREAKLLASLSHPNIAIVKGPEQAGDVHALRRERAGSFGVPQGRTPPGREAAGSSLCVRRFQSAVPFH